MSKELVIGSNRHETKVAVLEDDQLVELFFQRGDEYSLAGSIHKGRVTRVLPGMQSAFVDLGLERDTFLYVSDFFEEHDDIDTVAEEKPARGRDRERDRDRDRGRTQNRELERVAAPAPAPAILETETRIMQPAESPAAADEIAPGEEGLPVARIASPEVVEQKSGDRDTDRGQRGDRRGRRSRRRRSRGRGFPENKYAQPATTDSAEPELVEEQEETPRDVIILPGESLAKYRNRPATDEELSAAHGDESTGQQDAPESEVSPHQPDAFGGVPAEDLEAQAQEIELVDKVFSHRDEDEPVADEQEKLAAVKEDQPASPFLVQDIDVGEESAPLVASEGEIAEIPRAAEVRVSLPRDEEGSDGAAIDDELGDGISAAEYAEDEVSGSEPLDIDDLELPGSPAGVAGEPGSAAESDVPGGPAVQSASVREQGGRYMHRVSRRMRRRRGGNRFDQHPAQQEPRVEGPVASAAAAPALQTETRPETRRETEDERSSERPDRVMPSISELLKAGQEIIVQIAKEPLGQKGARITSHIALPGRYVVFMPSVTHLGVSRRIASDEERQRLKRILQAHRGGTTGGFIVRTAGEGVPEDEIAADMDFLYKLWLDIRSKAEKRPAPLLLHHDLDIVQRILRDQVTEEFKAIWVDNEDLYENVLSFMQRFQPALVNRVKMYTREAPIFDAFNVTQELEKALRPKVWLKSGGYIVINQTEALVAIDINTGKYVGKSNRLEDTIVKTNLEAVKEIVRQIRLRDLGGIIVVDFIDMDERKNRQKVMQALEETMHADRAPYKILQFNDFGLVAITRKRVKQSLERTLCAPCPYCEGAGYVKSVQTIVGEILVEAQKIAKAIEGKDVMLRVNTDVAKVLKASDNKYLEELEEILKRPVMVKGDPSLHHEKFDLG